MTKQPRGPQAPHFTLGTLSAGAAAFTVVGLTLHGSLFAFAILAIVYAVPCVAAYHKKPAHFWRPFTLLSVFGTIGVTFFLSFVVTREIDGHIVVGFPIGVEPGGTTALAPFLQPNVVLVSGLCLLPLGLASTVDTLRRARKRTA